MSMTNEDIVGHFLNEQARVNALNDEGDVNIVVEDLQNIGSGGTEEIGFGLVGESVVGIDYASGPRYWDDDDMVWGFFTWP